ncbi:MAG: hypothetical protein GXP29_02845, partial [Planctomycetes bacterium]|nr:hypothetical protein [Planctomycetota bacterium]
MTFKPDDLNPNPINTDDPRFTAYALGELGEKESAEIKAALYNSPEAQRTVDGIRETAQLLKQSMDDEPMVGLTENHRRTVEARIDESSKKVASAALPSSFRKALWISSGLAASVLLAVSIWRPSFIMS